MVGITSSISETVTPSLAKIHKDALNTRKFSHTFQNIDYPKSNVEGTWSLPLRATKAVKAKDLSGPSL